MSARALDVRLNQHLSDSLSGGGTHKRHWLRTALDAGRTVEIERLDEAPTSSEALWLERLWIAVYRACGVPLVNAIDGGRGCLNPTDLTRQKLRDSHLGHVHSEATKARMRKPKCYPANRKSRAITPEFRERMRQVALARGPMSAMVKSRISATKTGQTHSAETKAKMAAAQCSHWQSLTPVQHAARLAAQIEHGGFGSVTAALAGATARWSKPVGG